jgi:exoribonuclease-2
MKLKDIAYQVMLERGFIPDFSTEIQREVEKLKIPIFSGTQSKFKDLRNLFWFSIDNDDSLDLDQITYAEKSSTGKDKVYIGIADVDVLVKQETAIDERASHNTTSVYVPTYVFPMLPLELSTGLTSLNEGQERCSVVVEIEVDEDGVFSAVDIYPAWVKNHAKLTYNKVGDFLENGTPLEVSSDKSAILTEQLKLQDKIARKIRENRFREGALGFSDIEVIPIIENDIPVRIEEISPNRARSLIANLMVAANVCVTRFLDALGMPILRRIVRVPQRWERIVYLAKQLGETLPDKPEVKALRDFLFEQKKKNPEGFQDLSIAVIKLIGKGEYVAGLPGEISPGHFDLALQDYAHTTAPNRRFPDLIMQRLLKSHFYNQPLPYKKEDLIAMASHCTQKEDDATKVERRVRKSAIAMVFSNQIGNDFAAIVTGAAEKGTWVKLKKPPVEGKLVKGFEGVDVGDKITVKLIHTDPVNGFIDFARVK